MLTDNPATSAPTSAAATHTPAERGSDSCDASGAAAAAGEPIDLPGHPRRDHSVTTIFCAETPFLCASRAAGTTSNPWPTTRAGGAGI
jgi:hypothetical protein